MYPCLFSIMLQTVLDTNYNVKLNFKHTDTTVSVTKANSSMHVWRYVCVCVCVCVCAGYDNKDCLTAQGR